MTRRRLLAGVCVTAVVATAGAGAVAPGEAAKKRPPSQAVVAKKLAARVTSARTPAARYRALLAVMRALNVGVYTGAGRAIVRGAERSVRDFWLYDFDVRAVASALARGENLSVEDLGGQLAALGIARAGQPLPAADIGRIVVSGTRRARANPTGPRALLPLLARELGLRREPRYDLANGLPEAARFDWLQTLLLLADAVAPARSPRVMTSVSARALVRPCGVFGPVSENTAYFLRSLRWPPGEMSAADKVVAFHALLLYPALSVESIVPEPGKHATHYGPPGHDPDAGKKLRFQARIVMTVDTSQTEISCGPLRAQRLPPKGPVPGLEVNWKSRLEDRSGTPEAVLGGHGSAWADLASDENGLLTLEFTPKDEKVPGFGRERTADGSVGFRFAIPLEVPERVRLELEGSQLFSHNWPITIGYHKPRGFKFERLNVATEFIFPPGWWYPTPACPLPRRRGYPSCSYGREDSELSGRVCGDDPFAKPWEFRRKFVQRFVFIYDDGTVEGDTTTAGEIPFTRSTREQLPWPFSPGVGEYMGQFDIAGKDGAWKAMIDASAPEFEPNVHPRSLTLSAPLEEDTSCPEN
jgi:hypothetical protein